MRRDAPLSRSELTDALCELSHRYYADANTETIEAMPDEFDPVIHEICHAVTIPGTPHTSRAVGQFLNYLDPDVADRFEFAAWMVQHAVNQRFMRRWTLRRSLSHVRSALQLDRPVKWLRERWEEWEADDNVMWVEMSALTVIAGLKRAAQDWNRKKRPAYAVKPASITAKDVVIRTPRFVWSTWTPPGR